MFIHNSNQVRPDQPFVFLVWRKYLPKVT